MVLSTQKALVLLLVVAMAFTIDSSQGSDDDDGVEDLVKKANEAGAPFTETALERLRDTELWNAKRASRTTDAAIINASGKSFKLASSTCNLGIFSDGLLPENELKQKSSTAFGIQNSSKLQGVQCLTAYESEDGTFIFMNIGNPFYGDTAVDCGSSSDLEISAISSHDSNNQVTFMVSEK